MDTVFEQELDRSGGSFARIVVDTPEGYIETLVPYNGTWDCLHMGFMQGLQGVGFNLDIDRLHSALMEEHRQDLMENSPIFTNRVRSE